MGILGTIREVLGFAAERDATTPWDADDLFQLSAASVTMEADLDYDPLAVGGLCFGSVSSTDFTSALRDVEGVLRGPGFAEIRTDDHGYTWAVCERPTFEDVLAELYIAADTLEERGYGDRLLAAVFPFEAKEDGQTVYWVYSFRRGSFYPFAPLSTSENERDSTAEFKLQSLLGDELDVEQDTGYWYPLWPDEPGNHPWE